MLWSVLAPDAVAHHHPHSAFNIFSYNMHAINTVMLLVEWSCNRMVLKPGGLAVFLLWLLLYNGFAWAQNAETHFWPSEVHAASKFVAFFCKISTHSGIPLTSLSQGSEACAILI